MRFVKMHGLGNDFILLPLEEKHPEHPGKAARELCRRAFGVGADGLVLLGPSERAGLFMRIYNSDGSEAEMCGNALRCVALYARSHGLAPKDTVTVETRAGIKTAAFRPGGLIRVDMGVPVLDSPDIPVTGARRRVISEKITAGNENFRFTAVSMGNPHCVIFLEEGRQVDLAPVGSVLEKHPFFPQGTNVEFCRVEHPGRVAVQVWERGAGPTLACGTGACAVVVAGVTEGLLERQAEVSLPGGVLKVFWSPEGSVYMEGPATEVYRGEI